MPAEKDDLANSLDGRVTKLEELFTHLQRTLLELNEAVIECHRRTDLLDARLSRLASAVVEQTAGPERPFDPEAERPPHY